MFGRSFVTSNHVVCMEGSVKVNQGLSELPE
jgi:hypothetical protein